MFNRGGTDRFANTICQSIAAPHTSITAANHRDHSRIKAHATGYRSGDRQ